MTKTLIAALALTVLPGFAFAACFGHDKEETAMTCASGSVYDEATETCVPTTG